MALKFIDLTGQISGSNVNFVLTTNEYAIGSTLLVLNGGVQRLNVDYNENADQKSVTLLFVPTASDILTGYFDEFSSFAPIPPSTGGNKMAQDLDDILGIFGDPADGTGPGLYSIVRRTDTYSDSGSGTPTWTQVDLRKGTVQAYVIKGESHVKVGGVEVYNDFLGIFPPDTSVIGHDRVRPPGWVAGNDEYMVESVDDMLPSHRELRLTKVLGHAS